MSRIAPLEPPYPPEIQKQFDRIMRGAPPLTLFRVMAGNKRAWEKVPEDVRAIVAKNINAAAMNERIDTEKLNATVRQDLASKGLTFNQPDVAPFREKLRSAGFYAEWKGKYGDQAWELLEKSVGKLS